MDWNLIRSLVDANLDQVLAKATDPTATLTALARKISAGIEMVEGHIATLDARSLEMPQLLGTEQAMIAKVEAVVAKATQEGKSDLATAAKARLAKHKETFATLSKEQDQLDAERDRAEDALTKLTDRSLDIEARGVSLPLPDPSALPKPAAPSPEPRAPSPAAPSPAAPSPKPAAASPTPAKKGGGNLDDEFAALLSGLNVNLDEVELPKKPAKAAAAKAMPKDDDLGIPDLVDVKDGELPEGEDDDLPPLKAEKYNVPPPKQGKGAPPAKAAPVAAPAKAGALAKTGAQAAAKAPAKTEPAKGSKRWLWISAAVVTLGGAGAAVAHFALGLF